VVAEEESNARRARENEERNARQTRENKEQRKTVNEKKVGIARRVQARRKKQGG
jgi:hypothetical protein